MLQIWRSGQAIEKRYKAMTENKKCAICKQAIPESRTSHNLKYCSEKCARQAEAIARSKVISKRANHINSVAHLVYKAYECKCAICGWQATPDLIKVNGAYQYAHGNTIHHIIPVNKGGSETDYNLILLCPNHHKQADLGLISIEDLQKHTKRFTMTKEEKQEAVNKCIDAISSSIF